MSKEVGDPVGDAGVATAVFANLAFLHFTPKCVSGAPPPLMEKPAKEAKEAKEGKEGKEAEEAKEATRSKGLGIRGAAPPPPAKASTPAEGTSEPGDKAGSLSRAAAPPAPASPAVTAPAETGPAEEKDEAE